MKQLISVEVAAIKTKLVFQVKARSNRTRFGIVSPKTGGKIHNSFFFLLLSSIHPTVCCVVIAKWEAKSPIVERNWPWISNESKINKFQKVIKWKKVNKTTSLRTLIYLSSGRKKRAQDRPLFVDRAGIRYRRLAGFFVDTTRTGKSCDVTVYEISQLVG